MYSTANSTFKIQRKSNIGSITLELRTTMRPFVLALVCCLTIIPRASTELVTSNGVVPSDYRQLVEYSHLAAVAYCVKKGLSTGELGEHTSKCPMEVCRDHRLRRVELVKVFDFHSRWDAGAGFVGIDHGQQEILLAFRGTASRGEWKVDLDFVPVRYTPLSQLDMLSSLSIIEEECIGCTTHRGFYNLVKKRCVDIIEDVIRLAASNPDYKVVVMGHSLGAALAVLCGVELQLLGLNPLVISYGLPRLGSRAFVEFVNKIFDTPRVAKQINKTASLDRGLIRVTHATDIVPHLPSRPFFATGLGYEYHITKEMLPHDPEDLERRGVRNNDDDPDSDSDTELDANGKKISAMFSRDRITLSGIFQKYSHVNYFRQITDCSE